MANRDIVVIGASAGGMDPLRQLVSDLPPELPAAVFVVMHIGASPSILPQLLSNAGPLPARGAEDGARVERGHIYVAPPDRHMLVVNGRVAVRRSPRENGVRPAIDPLFRSAARYHGSRVVGVVLSGALDDGTAGLSAVKRSGGVAVVQDPADAGNPSMPQSALAVVEVDHVVSSRSLGPLIARLVAQGAAAGTAPTADLTAEVDVAEHEGAVLARPEEAGTVPVMSCPDCGGRLTPILGDDMLRYRCMVGHAHTAKTLLAAQSSEVERALWVALRTNQERAALLRRMALDARHNERRNVAKMWDEKAAEYEAHAAVLRELLSGTPANTAEPVESIDEVA